VVNSRAKNGDYVERKSEKKEMRFFVAAEVPDCFKKQVVRAQAHLRHRQICYATYPQSTVLHLTLAFLGDVRADQLPALQQALRTVVVPPVKLELDGIDFWSLYMSPGMALSSWCMPLNRPCLTGCHRQIARLSVI
jgi:hypothetical protein